MIKDMTRRLCALCIVMMAMLAMPGSAWAGKYIKELTVVSNGNSGNAKNILINQGFEVLERDLNQGADGDYIYIGYKTTDNADEAITSLVIMDGGAYAYSASEPKTRVIGKYTYQPVKTAENWYNGDLNRKAGGADLFLWYSTSDRSGGVITKLDVTESWNKSNLYARRSTGSDVGDPCDMNRKAGGKYLYLRYETEIPSSNRVPAAEPHFKVVDMGGGLYQIDLPMAVKDENGKSWIMGGHNTSTSLTVSYQNQATARWEQVLDVNSVWPKDYTSGEEFESEWQYRLNSATMGKLYSPSTLQEMEKGRLYPIQGGNKSDLKLQSFLWKKPDGVNISMFRFNAYGYTNFETTNQTISAATCTKSASAPQAPSGMNTITVVDPIINLTAEDTYGNTINPGSQKVQGYTAGGMSVIALWDPEKGAFLDKRLSGEPSLQGFSYDIDAQDEPREYVAYMYGEYKSISSSGQNSTTMQAYSVPITIKPFHSIRDIRVESEGAVDKEGKYKQKNTIRWKVDNVRYGDALEQDLYLIQRAYDPDFADAETIGQYYVSTNDSTVFEIIDENGRENGLYTYVDEDDRSWINPEQEGTDREIYYRVTRAVIFGVWKNASLGEFEKRATVKLGNYLPKVGNITVTKTPGFESGKTVKLRVELPMKQEFAKGESPEELFDKLRSGAVTRQADATSHYYFMNETDRQFLAIENGRLTFSPRPFEMTSTSGWILKDDFGNYLSQDGQTPPSLVVTKTEEGAQAFQRTATKVNGKIKHTFTMSQGGKTYYLNGTGLSTDLYYWTLVHPSSTVVDNTPNKDIAAKYVEQRNKHCLWVPSASITIHRYSPAQEHYEGRDYAEKTISIEGSMVKWDNGKQLWYAEIEDIQAAPYTHYYYSACVDTTRSNYPIADNTPVVSTKEDADNCYSETLSAISRFEATRGSVKGRVALEWEAEDGLLDEFTLERLDYPNGTVAKTLPLKSRLATSYVDTEAESGKVYSYRLTASCSVRGNRYEVSRTVYGWNPYMGTLKGKVQLKNEAAMPGKVTVTVRSQQEINIDEVRDAAADTIIVQGHTGRHEQSLTVTDGTFSFDSIPYLSAGSRYDITVSAEGAEFSVAGQQGVKTFVAAIDDQTYEKSVNFVCATTRQFSGRVLYDHSTIPVRDCQFLMNGSLLLDANGEPITTDGKGRFSFLLPVVDMTVQVAKEGHTFANGGYILGRDADTLRHTADSLPAGAYFRPSEDYNGLELADSTKVRLVGRMAGGDIQGSLPLGYGLSRNNLGDNLKLVLELEGDNTSQIVYNADRPDETTRRETFSQRVSQAVIGEVAGTDTLVAETEATFEKKRIVVRPDVTSGEFCIDLAPTKYKIVELSADGYPTLFTEGEGFQVLDLTHAVQLQRDTLFRHPGFAASTDLRTTSYHSLYKRTYHNPVNVTYAQLEYEVKELSYFGEKTLSEYCLSDEQITANLFTEDPVTHEVTYTFGHPVFADGKDYDIKVFAHEDYYYNGNAESTPDVVHLSGGLLRVRNGLQSSRATAEYALDSLGTAVIPIHAGNTSFSLQEEDALRSLNVEVVTDGYTYDAKPLRAYVTGWRDKGIDIVTLDGGINVVDVIRDPYGSKSYAYREAGTKYHWSRKQTIGLTSSVDISLKTGTSGSAVTGAFAGLGAGAFVGTTSGSSSTINVNTSVQLLDVQYVHNAEYDMTLKTRVQTSSATGDVGADADVFLGLIETVQVGKVDRFSIIDETTYRFVQPAIQAGKIRIVSEGQDSRGKRFYLAISEKMTARKSTPREFVYTQRHIRTVVIPQLAQTYRSLILTGSQEEVQQIANLSGKIQYRLLEGKTLADEDCFEPIAPCDQEGKAIDVKMDDINPYTCLHMISQWLDVLAGNERLKADAIGGGKPMNQYSLSSGTKIDHSEASSTYEFKDKVFKLGNYSFTDGDWEGINLAGSGGTKKKGSSADEVTKQKGQDQDGNEVEAEFTIPGLKFKFDFDFNVNLGMSQDADSKTVNTAGSGYVLETGDGSYLDIDVYGMDPYTVAGYTFTDGQWDFVSVGENRDEDKYARAQAHNFVFSKRGGAERNPWYEPDSTLYYEKGTPLALRTMKIDNPKIYVDQPVISNLPANEKAYFQLRITNESELTNASAYSSTLLLYQDDKTIPNGTRLSIDGVPLQTGISLKVSPGQTLVKTLQVERGGKDYDIESIAIGVKDQSGSLKDVALLSVHYLPTSTPVKIIRPMDKWVMNTLSAQDEQGRYYLPVEVSGFDINYDNFDHIELQYKKHTEGDSKWVNICSYYANDSLFQMASGEKDMLHSGTFSRRFYGEMDPVEMAYDLRAVSFCRLGSGYVTQASDVVSGIKDTRVPEVFGKPKPTNGILTYEDVISIPFNEPIAYNYLDETANFKVTGFTNNSDRVYETTLRFPAPTEVPDWDIPDPNDKEAYEAYVSALEKGFREWLDVPTSKVKRNLTGRDFTIDAMVKMDDDTQNALFFVLMDKNQMKTQQAEQYMLFGTTSGRLYALFNGMRFISEPLNAERYTNDKLSLSSGLTQVAMTYRQAGNTQEGEPQVRFYVSGVEVLLDKVSDSQNRTIANDVEITCDAYGEVSIGSLFAGNMADIRLWDKALSLGELTAKKGKRLSGTEPALMGYWPIDEMNGTILYDKANGANLHFSRQNWQMPEGQHSLRLDDEGIELQNAEEFLRRDFNDFTLSLWINPDKDLKTNLEKGVTLFQSGSDLNEEKFRIYFNESSLMLQSGGRSFAFCPKEDVTDGRWHNLVVVANKSQNTAGMYLDGNQMQSLSGTELKGMHDQVTLGGKGFHGNIDVLTFWHLAFATNNLNLIHNMSPTGNEMGLAYYLPFETDERNSQNTWQSVFSPYNEVKSYKEDGTEAAKKLAILPREGSYRAYDDSKSFPAVKTLTGLTNLPFTWTSTDNELQINIKKNDAEINHQQLFITVRGVEDQAGNSLANPQMLMVYVDRNVLVWDKKSLELEVPYGSGSTVRASWSNKSGRVISYTIENNNSWLKLSNKMGVAQPLCNENIELEISDGLAPGEYTATVYLIDESQLSSPMTISVNVKASEPNMAVVSDASYRYTMNVMGRVKIKNEGGAEYYDMDERDVVYAVHDGLCVGKAYLTVDNERNTSMVNLTIYGNDEMIEEASDGKGDIGFVLWRASTNVTSILQAGDDLGIVFRNNGMIGCPPEDPVIFTLNNDYKQLIPLEAGWNWVSFNVNPKRDKGLNSLFESNTTFTQGDRIVFGNMAAELLTDSLGKLTWSGQFDDLDNHVKRVYQIYAQKPCYATVFGSAYSETERFVSIKASNGNLGRWNDLPYLLSVDQPINIAMSDFAKDRAEVGSVIKSRKQFAVMNKDGEWIGSLQYMHPGEGYYLRYLGKSDTDIRFTNTSVAEGRDSAVKTRTFSLNSQDSSTSDMESTDLILRQGGEYASSMPVIAQLDAGTEYREGDLIVAYAGGEMVGMTDVAISTECKELLFISLNAAQDATVRFAHVRNGKVLAKSRNGISYDAQGMAGSLEAPFVIEFAETNAPNGIFDLNGIRLTEEKIRNRRGVFIINGEKRVK